jgi:hypothetical protein
VTSWEHRVCRTGWIPSPIPAIYTGPDLLDYRRYLPLFGIEGQRPLNGSFFSADIDPAGTILSLALVGKQYAEPVTEVTVVWGEHPGPGTPADADLGFPRIRATVAPAPFDEHARTRYRRHTW